MPPPAVHSPPASAPTAAPKSSVGAVPLSASQKLMPAITKALDDFTTHAAALPVKSDLAFHRTLDRSFARGLDATSKRVLGLTEQLIRIAQAGTEKSKDGKKAAAPAGAKAKPRVKLEEEEDVVDGYRRNVVDAVDGLLEDADSKIDELKGEKRKAAIEIDPAVAAQAAKMLPGPRVYTNLPDHLRLDVNMAKPQLQFADGVDNSSEEAWRPSLPTKHHAMVPMEWKAPPVQNEAGPSDTTAARRRAEEQRRRQHPYWFETQHLPYPTSMFKSKGATRPASFDKTPLTWVDTPEELERLTEKLKAAKEIAIDLEHHSTRSYAGFTCLMQISTRKEDWVVDTLKLRQELREGKLGGTLADPSIVKVFHGADSDIVWLQQDFDIYVVNLFDTYHATHVLGFHSHSLASLLARFCNYSADKRYQLADWRIRPPTPEMLQYARADTHFLLYIYDELRNALLAKSSRPSSPVDDEDGQVKLVRTPGPGRHMVHAKRHNPQEDMRAVLDKSAMTALQLYERRPYAVEGDGRDGWKGAIKSWSPQSTWAETGHVFRKLHKWRDDRARELDESIHYIVSNGVLRRLALAPMNSLASVKEVLAAPSWPPSIASQFANDIYSVILEARAEWPSVKGDVLRLGTDTGTSAKARAEQSRAAVPSEPPAAATSGVPEATLEVGGASQVGHAQSGETPPVGSAETAADDLWAPKLKPVDVSVAPAAATAKAKSSLFGATLPKASKSATAAAAAVVPTPTVAKAKSSSSALFGKTLKKPTIPSAPIPVAAGISNGGFQDVLKEVMADIAPIAPPSASTSAGEPSAPAANATNVLPEPETVPFVPAEERSTIAAPNDNKWTTVTPKRDAEEVPVPVPAAAELETDVIPVTEQAPVAKFDGVAVMTVKRKKPSKKEKARPADAQDTPATGSPKKKQRLSPDEEPVASGSGANIKPQSKASKQAAASEKGKAIGKKAPKAPIKPEDIPAFDYSRETNLLDNPNSGTVEDRREAKGKKGKKEKKARKGPAPLEIETPKFGKNTPKDRSQPRAGNISRTFAS